MTVDLGSLKAGDVLDFWHDTGAFGHKLHYARVTRVGSKMVRVLFEYADREVWRRPQRFNSKVSDQTVADLRADGVTI